MVISPFKGSKWIHCLLGGTSILFWFVSRNSKGSDISFLLQVPSIYLPSWNIVTGPTPTVNTLGSVVASSLYKGPWITTTVGACKISSYPSLVIKLWATASVLGAYPSAINLLYWSASSFQITVVFSLYFRVTLLAPKDQLFWLVPKLYIGLTSWLKKNPLPVSYTHLTLPTM